MAHGKGFDESKVPDGPAADWFYSGKPGESDEREGLSDEEYDETKARMLKHVAPEDLPWAKPVSE
jgi:hypothetical protein